MCYILKSENVFQQFNTYVKLYYEQISITILNVYNRYLDIFLEIQELSNDIITQFCHPSLDFEAMFKFKFYQIISSQNIFDSLK